MSGRSADDRPGTDLPLGDQGQKRGIAHAGGGGVARLQHAPGADAAFGGLARGQGVFHGAARARAGAGGVLRSAKWADISAAADLAFGARFGAS